MDKALFKQIIEQYCEVEVLTPKKSPTVRLDETDINDVLIDGEWTTIDQNVNPSLGIKIKKLKEVQRACDLGCGKTVPNQVIEIRKCETPYTHWRTRCHACSAFVAPDGEGFIEGGHQIQSAYVKHYYNNEKELKAKQKPKSKPTDYEKEFDCTYSRAHSTKNTRWVTDSEGNITLKQF